MNQLFAVDIGGTFTDLVVLDAETGSVRFAKASTTPTQPADGVLDALERGRLALPDASMFFHGTTLGINTMLEGKGATVGVVTTRGFRDALEIGRMTWPMYQLHWDQPAPLVPRHLRAEVAERVRADGTVLQALDEDGLRRAVDELLKAGAESIAVCFLHAYAFPKHEQLAGKIITSEYPDVPVTLSHLVTQEYREYERTATTVADAAIRSRMVSYIDDLESNLRNRQYTGGFVMTRCDGGVMSAREARERCIRTFISGPASGVMGAVALGRWIDEPNLITTDMGGTSFDASLIIDHEPTLSSMTRVGGLPLLVPVIDLSTIGAGGGSIAWIDAGGALDVGPQSAGAEPGPICYGRGGAKPTFTDAAVVSGLLAAEKFLGGEMNLDVGAAREGIRKEIAEPLGLEVEEAASGIVALIEAKMAATLEELTIGKGYDPRDFTLLAYGGGGSLVACALASKLEIPTAIVPASPATFSAWGMLTLDVVHDFARTAIAGLDALGPADLAEPFEALRTQADTTLQREGVAPEDRLLLHSLDMRYDGQEHTLTVSIASTALEELNPDRIREAFDERHAVAYGYSMSDPVEVTAYRIRAVGSLGKPQRPSIGRGGPESDHARTGARRATHRESGGTFDWSIYARSLLQSGNRLVGPAIVEEDAATTLVPPGFNLVVDDIGNLRLSLVERGR